ncbi:unnamed protein product, partial [marine sediment metagenome]
VHFTKIIEQKTKDKGMAMRYAGDEFVLLMPRMEKPDAKIFALEIQNSVRTSPLKYKEKTISMGCSIGISLFPEDGKSWKTLFEKADEALYVAKRNGQGRGRCHAGSRETHHPIQAQLDPAGSLYRGS